VPKKYSLYSPTAAFQRRLARKARQNKLWLTLAVSYWLFQAVRRGASRGPEIAAIDKLMPGQGLVIRTIVPPTRRERKAAKRAR
jgi:hypothetical protein